jgi:tetratricopeptide (TPR) repeat protein
MEKQIHKPLFLTLLVLFCFGLFLPVGFAQETPYWEKAGNLIQSGSFIQALEEIDRLLVSYPDKALLLRLKGICFINLKDPDKAVKVLEKASQIDPDNIAIKFYLAKALTYQGNILESIDLLSLVQEKAPDSPYADIARRIIPRLLAAANVVQPINRQKRWNLYGSLSEEYDDNVSAAAREDDDVVTDSFRTVTSGAFEYRFIDQYIDDNNFSLGVRHSLYYSWHGKDKFSSYNLGINSSDLFFVRPGTISSMPYTFQLEANYTNARLNNNHYSDAVGLSSSLWIEWHQKATIVPKYRVVWEDFKEDTAEPGKYSRDSWSHYIGLDHYLQLLNENLLWGLGCEYRITNADGSQFDRDSYNIFTSFQIALPKDMSLFTRIDYTKADYTKYDPDPKRTDDIFTVNTILTYPLSKDNIYLRAGHTFLRSNSKTSFSDYKRNLFSLAVDFYM